MRISDWSSDVCSSDLAWRRYCDIIFLNSTCQDDKCCMVDENHSEWHEPRIQRSHGGPVSGAAEVDQMQGKIFATPAALAACLLAAAPAQAQFGSLLRQVTPSSEERRGGKEWCKSCKTRWTA